jgi:hypothetical protein
MVKLRFMPVLPWSFPDDAGRAPVDTSRAPADPGRALDDPGKAPVEPRWIETRENDYIDIYLI